MIRSIDKVVLNRGEGASEEFEWVDEEGVLVLYRQTATGWERLADIRRSRHGTRPIHVLGQYVYHGESDYNLDRLKSAALNALANPVTCPKCGFVNYSQGIYCNGPSDNDSAGCRANLKGWKEGQW